MMMTEAQREMYEQIPIGRQNAISRRDLAEIWGMCDREARDTISVLRREYNSDRSCEYAILSGSGSRGYWRSNDNAEVLRFNREAEHRMFMISRTRLRTVGKGLLEYVTDGD